MEEKLKNFLFFDILPMSLINNEILKTHQKNIFLLYDICLKNYWQKMENPQNEKIKEIVFLLIVRFLVYLVFYNVISWVNWVLRSKAFFLVRYTSIFIREEKLFFLSEKKIFCDQRNNFFKKKNFLSDPKLNSPKKSHYKEKLKIKKELNGLSALQ